MHFPSRDEVNAVMALTCLSGAELEVLGQYVTLLPGEWERELLREKELLNLAAEESDAVLSLEREDVSEHCPVYHLVSRVNAVMQAHAVEVMMKSANAEVCPPGGAS